jgi:hypothetical protein
MIPLPRQRSDQGAANADGEDIPLPFDLPAVARKKLSAAFDGGRITSNGGVMLLAQAERRMGIADQLARVIPDGRDADRVVHLLPDILRARILAIACGYEDADDLDQLRFDPAFKLACGRLPDTGRDLCSQPTVSRWENVPSLRDLIRLMGVMIDLYCASYAHRRPLSITDPNGLVTTLTYNFRGEVTSCMVGSEPPLPMTPLDSRSK